MSLTRILEWYQHWNGRCYVSFSGGKDSTVLADLCARVVKEANYSPLVLVYCDTGLEYPEIRSFVKEYREYLEKKYDIEVKLDIVTPAMHFSRVIQKYGFPVISKDIAGKIYYAQQGKPWAQNILAGKKSDGRDDLYNKRFMKWAPLVNAPFKIGDGCCRVMKKEPMTRYEKATDTHPLLGNTCEESELRLATWLKFGCNGFTAKHPKSTPLAFWFDQDILEYIHRFNVPIASVYGDVVKVRGDWVTTGVNRTGCIYCGFGLGLESLPNRYQRMAVTHPKQWDYALNTLGFKDVFDYLNLDYEPTEEHIKMLKKEEADNAMERP